MTVKVLVEPDVAAVARHAERLVVAAGVRAVSERGRFRLVLAGGSTPGRLYEGLASREEIDWTRTELYFGDERGVPPTHEASNYRMVRTALLDRLPTPPALVERMRGELPVEIAAEQYREVLALRSGSSAPRFDLVLLGMGADGHTASLFPCGPELLETDLPAVASRSPVAPHARVTLTLPVLNAAREVLFLVAGADKAKVLHQVLREHTEPGLEPLPAARVLPREGTLTWLVDEAARAGLSPRSRLSGDSRR